MYASRRTGACVATEMREWNAAFNEARTVEATLRYATFEDGKGRDIEERGRMEEIATRDAMK
jgi:hypothetical protein